MASVKIKNVSKVLGNVQKLFDNAIESKAFLEEINDYAVNRIVAETRKGNSLPNEQKLPPLNSKYVKFRKLIKAGKIEGWTIDGEFFKPGKSNLTFSGQLLRSVQGKVQASKRTLTVGVTGGRKPVYTPKGSGMKSRVKKFLAGLTTPSNAEVAKDLASRGFKFLGLDDKGVKSIRKMVLDQIRRAIRRK